MLERHFRSFKAIDRITALWLGPQIERYVQSLDEQHASNATVRQHVRTLAHFNDFVLARGVTQLQELPDHVDAFVERWKAEHGGWCKSAQDVAAVVAQSRIPVERMLCVALPGYTRPSNKPALPFSVSAPGFFTFLVNEKGLRPTTLHNYTYTLRPFEAYLARADIALAELTPACITEFLNERAKTLHKAGMLNSACALRVFLRYLHREGIVPTDLVRSVPRGRVYRQAPFRAPSAGRTSSGCLPASTNAPSWASATTPFWSCWPATDCAPEKSPLSAWTTSTGRMRKSVSRCARVVTRPATRSRQRPAKPSSGICRFDEPMWHTARSFSRPSRPTRQCSTRRFQPWSVPGCAAPTSM